MNIKSIRFHSTIDPWYCFLLLAQLLLVWLLPYFPTQDGPSHLYNAAILHDPLNGGKEWGEYFRYKLKAVPNLGFNLIVYPNRELGNNSLLKKGTCNTNGERINEDN